MSVVHRVRFWGLLGLALAACGERGNAPSDKTETRPTPSALTAGPKVALLVSAPEGNESAWVETTPLASALPAPLARLSHLAAASVHAALLPHRRALVAVADMERTRDGTFGSWLVVLEANASAKKIIDHCVRASRPVVLGDGGVLVERGQAGPEPSAEEVAAGALRSDELSVARVDVESGQVTTLHAFAGYATHLAGLAGNEVVLYRVAFQHADLVAVDVETGAERTIVEALPAFARDFSVDGRDLLFTNRLEQGWAVVRINLDSGEQATLSAAAGLWALPRAVPGGGLLLNDGRGGTVVGGRGLDRPLGPGFDVLEDVSSDGRFWALSHRVPGRVPVPYLFDSKTEVVLPIAVDGGRRAEIVGLVP
jgi:hypothetical protein